MASNLFMEDHDHYATSYKIFVATLSLYDMYADRGKEVFTKEIFTEEVVAKIQATLDDQEELRVLGVGSGTGVIDVTMLEKLMVRFPRINNRVVEPLHEHVVQYKELAQSKSHELQAVNFDWREQTIEEYEKAGDLTKFHFISSSHSMYYVTDLESTLMYLYNRLEPGGILFVDILSDNSGYYRFRRHFKSFNDHYNISSADIRSILDRQGIPYNQYHQPLQADISKCFDETSEEGNLLLDFLIQVVNVKEMASKDLQRQMIEYLGSSDCSERKNDGTVFLSGNIDSVVIKKPVP